MNKDNTKDKTAKPFLFQVESRSRNPLNDAKKGSQGNF